MQAYLLLALFVWSCLLAASAYALPGDLDASFGNGGRVLTPIGSGADTGNAVVMQSDGKLVVVGFSHNGANNDFAVVRYNANGTLDTTFNGNGKVTTDFGSSNDIANGVALQNDGKIVPCHPVCDYHHQLRLCLKHRARYLADRLNLLRFTCCGRYGY